MNETKSIKVVFATDENYVQHLCVSLLSLFHTQSNKMPLHIFVLGDNLSVESVAMITQIAEDHNTSISFPTVNFERFGDLGLKRHQSRVTYATLAIPEIIGVDKVLYLDCDLLVRCDISPLWEIDISKYYLGAVLDTFFSGLNGKQQLDSRLGMPPGTPYFNAGMLLMNLKKWRQDKEIVDKAIKFKVKNPGTHCNDQDGLNATLWGKWYPFHPRWNVQTYTFRMCYESKLRRMLPEEFIEAVKDPAIVHYTTGIKPWHYACRVPYVEEYYKYLAMTPWKNYRPARTFAGILNKNIRMIRRRVTGAMLGYRV